MAVRPRGIWLVTSLELRQRVRSIRWYVALGTWTVFLLLMSGLVFALAASSQVWTFDGLRGAGQIVFSISSLLLIFATLLISPALASGAINGDRTAGTLATLQATLLSPLEIVLGKVLAGWVTGLAFLVLSLPSVLPSALLAGVSPVTLIRELIAIALLTLCITAIGVGLSSVTARQLGSVVLTYLVVLGTTTILPIVFLCTLPMLGQDHRVVVYETQWIVGDGPDGGVEVITCERSLETRTVLRTDLTVPLLYVNPFVVVGDQARPLDLRGGEPETNEEVDVFRLVATGMRSLANPMHPSQFNECWDPSAAGYPTDLGSPTDRPLWPYGLAVWLATAGGSIALATWRLRTPMRHVGAGTRIA